jgi:multidrug efflux system membrane fusion protein
MNKTCFFFVVLLIMAIVSSCRKSPPQKEEVSTIPVRTEIVKEQMVSFPVHTTGRLSAKTESRLSFKTGGIIQKFYVEEGQIVNRDQLLASLNLSEIQPRARQAELALQKAERDFKRAKNLYEDSVVTLEQFQDAQTALEVTRANANIAKFNLTYSEIRAPSAGKILKRVSEVNEIVGPGQPVFLFASTESAWVVRAALTDKDIVNIRMDDSATVSFDAYPDRKFKCHVSEIGTIADPYTGTYEVELHLDEQPETLATGFITRAEIYPASTLQKMIIIPLKAMIDGKGLTGTVYVIRDGSPVKQSVRIHSIRDDGLVISSGLQVGDEIIIEGGEYIREGTIIQRD